MSEADDEGNDYETTTATVEKRKIEEVRAKIEIPASFFSVKEREEKNLPSNDDRVSGAIAIVTPSREYWEGGRS